jgi:putative ATP-binding cassette transporter
LSLLAFAVSVVVICLAGVIFHIKSRQVAAGTREAADWDNRLFDRLIDLLDGFKEVRLNRSRSDDLFDDVVEVSRKAANIKIRSQSESYKQLVFSQELDVPAPRLGRICGPCFQRDQRRLYHAGYDGAHVRRGSMHGYRANDTLSCWPRMLQSDNIERLEAKLRAIAGAAKLSSLEPRTRFDTIEMRNVVFSYMDKSSEAVFRVGPLQLHPALRRPGIYQWRQWLRQIDIPQTALRLYEPDSGEILLDGDPGE